MKVVVDTSVLIYIVEEKADPIDVLMGSEHPVCRVLIPDIVLGELKKLASKGRSRKASAAASALLLASTLLSKNPDFFQSLSTGREGCSTDLALIAVAKENGFAIATADKSMKNLAEAEGVKVLFLIEAKKKLL